MTQATRAKLSRWLWWVLGLCLGIPMLLIAGYAIGAEGSVGSKLKYAAVGMLVAVAALAAGSIVGFVLGVPRSVSSGARRLQEANPNPSNPGNPSNPPNPNNPPGEPHPPGGPNPPADPNAAAVAEQSGTPPADDSSEGRFEPSTNLAEISDWLTKVLLGAGLVGLTQIGGPLGSMVRVVASGLEKSGPASDVSGSAQVMAGAIMCTYLALGILGGYILTTIAYTKELNKRLR